LNVLFIGNSFTARNDLPATIAALAASSGLTLHHRLISAGGASLRRHWNAGTAVAAIRAGGYDYVVLQEQSTLPIKNPWRMHENVRLFDEEIERIAQELGATVVPVGVAWQALLRRWDCPTLYDRDGSHPTLAGTYLAACVFFATLFGQDPLGIQAHVPGGDDAERVQLQQSAWRAVHEKKSAAPA
jgi:hypothetical protein